MMNVDSPKYFKENVRSICNDERLRAVVKKATTHSLKQRQDVVDQVPEWEDIRQQAYKIRKKTIENLNGYLEQFKGRVKQNGGEIIHVKDSNEAQQAVVGILKSVDAKLVVKSKSMVTEEIQLNEAVLRNDIEVVETDLGEYIIQLADERPSHITAPALHKSREDIGLLFKEKLGFGYTNNPAELTGFARNILREKFLKADAGISGANFLIAESGTIVLVENEGNARLTTTLPKVHIVIAGIEKVVPTLYDASILLKLLARSATGQKMTSYVSFINSAKRLNEYDGPEKIYVILLDNGRRGIKKNITTREALYCIKCGACMNVCPVYQSVGGHAYGSVYPGPIGAILTPLVNSFREAKDLAYGSSLCGACSEICPVKINLHHTLLWLRSQSIEKGYSSWFQNVIFNGWRIAMQIPFLYSAGSKLIRFLQPLFEEDGGSVKIPVWSDKKKFPKFAEKPFHELWKGE
jgi:L-lactate dehydrogenase complex protein LldF